MEPRRIRPGSGFKVAALVRSGAEWCRATTDPSFLRPVTRHLPPPASEARFISCRFRSISGERRVQHRIWETGNGLLLSPYAARNSDQLKEGLVERRRGLGQCDVDLCVWLPCSRFRVRWRTITNLLCSFHLLFWAWRYKGARKSSSSRHVPGPLQAGSGAVEGGTKWFDL